MPPPDLPLLPESLVNSLLAMQSQAQYLLLTKTPTSQSQFDMQNFEAICSSRTRQLAGPIDWL